LALLTQAGPACPDLGRVDRWRARPCVRALLWCLRCGPPACRSGPRCPVQHRRLV